MDAVWSRQFINFSLRPYQYEELPTAVDRQPTATSNINHQKKKKKNNPSSNG